MGDIFQTLNTDSELAKKFVRELFEHKEISNLLHTLVQDRVESEIKNRYSEEAEYVNFSDDLSK